MADCVSWEGTWEIGHTPRSSAAPQTWPRSKNWVLVNRSIGRTCRRECSFLVDQEANYGNSSCLRELAEKGYIFIAQHDAGGDYDAARLVNDGKTFCEVNAMVHEPLPCVVVNANGFVDKKQLQAVRKYWRAVARAKQKLGFADEEMK